MAMIDKVYPESFVAAQDRLRRGMDQEIEDRIGITKN